MPTMATPNITREQWIVATALAGAINACNAPFCVGENESEEEVNRDPSYIDNVATDLARQCGRMALEDAIDVLQKALAKHPLV